MTDDHNTEHHNTEHHAADDVDPAADPRMVDPTVVDPTVVDPTSGGAQDEPFDRLCAADPAADVEPDLPQIRATVTEQIGPRRTTAPTPGRWLRVAAATAAVLAVGVGGYLIGTAGSGDRVTAAGTVSSVGRASASASVVGPPVVVAAVGSVAPTGTGAAPAISLGGGGQQAVGGRAASGSTAAAVPEMAAGGAGGARSASADSAVGGGFWGWGRTVFHDSGLPTTGGTAQAWAYDPAQVVSAETAQRIATALGIQGSAVQQYGAWVVGSTDYTGPAVMLSGDGLGSVNYSNPTADPWYCPNQFPSAGPNSPDAPTAIIETKPVCEQRAIGAALSSDEAIARAKETMGLIGVDIGSDIGADAASYEFEAQPYDDPNGPYKSVAAYQVQRGQRTGQAWSFSFAADTLSNFWGALAPVVDAGTYEVISPAQAVARLNDPRFGSTAMAYPVDYVIPQGTQGSYVEPTAVTVPPIPAPNAPVAWPVTEVTITGYQLGVAQQYQPDGSVLLMPAYALTNAEGVSWSVIAIADDGLNFTPTP